jgi:ankyrin repeat protein
MPTDCVRLLMNCGVAKDAKDNDGMTALIWAGQRGHIGCASLLIDGGANMDAKDSQGITALIWAAHEGHTDCARLLINAGANKEASNKDKTTALMAAANNGHTDCLHLLMDAGANYDRACKKGMPALMAAACNGHTDCVRLLLLRGADKDAVDKCGLTALGWAQRNDKRDVIRLFASWSAATFDDMALMDPKRRARFMGRACHNCFKTNAVMFKCGLCKTARYCSKECQMPHWRLHKALCDRGGELRGHASSQQCESACSADSSLPHSQHNDDVASGPKPEA